MFLIKLLRTKKKEAQMTHSCLLILFNKEDSEFQQSILKMEYIKLMNVDYIMDLQSDNIIEEEIVEEGKKTYIS